MYPEPGKFEATIKTEVLQNYSKRFQGMSICQEQIIEVMG